MFNRARVWGMAYCLIALAALGCGADRPIPVQGRVTLDGQPLDGATVTFMSSGGSVHPATGYTDQAGVFHLTSFKKDDGAVRGEYRVLVTKIQAIDPPPDANSGERDAVLKHYRSLKSLERKSLLPGLYASYETTPLRCKVPPDGAVVLELESNPKKP
jgi:hypothetical protein